MSERHSSPGRAIALGGLIAGTLDITAAILLYAARGVPPVRILQSVATGLLGAASYQGGFRTAVLGTALHFFIATTATAVYVLASRRIAILAQRPLLGGPLYGSAVYLFMNLVVVPLSAARPQPLTLTMLAIHIVCVGLPIALATWRLAPAPAAASRAGSESRRT